ncbi:MAG TPA: PBP1A family penicillin-binding protein [Caldilineae bacterium]|nr:PBP1A family penicillin-binding protein [Caldilineae bacterium]
MTRYFIPPTDKHGRSWGRALLLVLVSLTLLATQMAGAAQTVDPDSDPAIDELTAQAIDRLAEVSGEPLFQTTRIYDRHGALLYELSDRGRRDVVPLEVIPEVLIQATLATEDKNFYQHTGVDWAAVARAAWQNWQADEIVSGASTITQQLARSLQMPEQERYDLSLGRKYREAVVALQIEDSFSKNEILEMYLNTIFYGHRSYGIVAAAKTYLDKELSELSLAEAAFLAGLPQAPIYYDPFVNPEAARRRQLVVLDLMERAGFITAAEKALAVAEPIRLVSPEFPELQAPHLVDFVNEMLLERYGAEGMRRGLQVHTTIDLRYQKLADQIARAQIDAIGSKYNASNASVVIIHPTTGEILAMVGSIDYYDEAISGQVNMAVQLRQPGSSIKPVVYATAFDRGWSPASVVWDTPVRYFDGHGGFYIPHNITGRYYGAVRVRDALSNSLNVPAIKMLHDVGVDKVLTTAHALGIRSWNKPTENYGLALAVGGYEVTLLELTNAFATFANGGVNTHAHAIREIQDAAGRPLYRAAERLAPQQAISPIAAYQLADVLSDTRSRQLVFGRNSALNTSQPAAVKTGTTDGWRDNLTVGFTPYVAVGVWVGNSDGSRMHDALGSSTAAPIWHDIMEGIWADPELYDSIGYAGQTLPQGFTAPEGIYKTPVCDIRAGKFNRNCPKAYEEALADVTLDVFFVPGSDKMVSSSRKGYCLPLLDSDVPVSVLRQASFVPLPTSKADRASARNWAANHNLRLTTIEECDSEPISRQVASRPTYPEPRQLVHIPEEPVEDDADEEIENIYALGVQVVVLKSAGTIKMYVEPGAKGGSAGKASPGETLVIRKGPQMIKNTPWFEVRNLDRGILGWVNGLYLRPKELRVTEGSDPDSLLIGGRARLAPDLKGLYVRSRPSSKAAVVGVVRPRDIVILQQGPQKEKRARWYEVFVEPRGIVGWVDGRYLVPKHY